MAITTVIPSLGLTALLRFCILHLERALQPLHHGANRIIVVDNASPLPYLQSDIGVDGVEILRLDRAHSFSHACNRGARRAHNDLILFLNNDVLLAPQALVDMVDTMTSRNAAICGARLVYPDDTIQHCGIRFGAAPPGPFHEHHRRHTSTVSRAIRDFQAVTGAAFMIRGDVYTALDGFDESFPFAYEDVDLCLRSRQVGHRVTCSQRVDSIHFESTTAGRFDKETESRQRFESRWRDKFSMDGKSDESR